MNQIVTSQARLFLSSIEIGILMGAFFDLIRIFRKIIPHFNLLVQLEDMLFWVICGFGGFYMLYVTNYADIRPFIFLGMILGAVFYFATFSIIFMKIATAVINYVKNLIKKIIHYMLIPVKGVLRYLSIPLKYIDSQYEKVKIYNKAQLRKAKRRQYIREAEKLTDKYIKMQKK